MGAQPGTMQPGLIPASPSTDLAPPTSMVTFPANGQNLSVGTALTITGTAVDSGGGVVAGVEVSVDGGATWHPATGRENWTYAWTPAIARPVTIMSRAMDDSGNRREPSAGVDGHDHRPDLPVHDLERDHARRLDGHRCGRARREVPRRYRRHHHRHPLLQGRDQHRHARREPVEHHGYAARDGDVHERDRVGLAAGQLRDASRGDREHDLRRVVSHQRPAAMPVDAVLLRDGRRRQSAPARARERCKRQRLVRLRRASAFPTQTFNAANYWVDVVFTTHRLGDTTPPTVTAARQPMAPTGVDGDDGDRDVQRRR